MELRTRLNDLLGIRAPILLAPMGTASGGALARAVSAAGGFGIVGGGYGDAANVRRELNGLDLSTVGVGFITWHLKGREAVLHEVLERKPKAMFLSFGDPTPYIDAIKAAGSLLICQVQTVADAKAAAKFGADIIVAQGTEAGGHGGSRGTMALVPAVVDAVAPKPVVAAGGLGDGRAVAAALMLGAEGALIGTRFMATPESLINPRWKARLVEAGGDDTLRTRVFDIVRGLAWPMPFTGRAIKNAFSERWHGHEAELAQQAAAELPGYQKAMDEQNHDVALAWAGEAVDFVKRVEPAHQVLDALVAETLAALQGSARHLRA
jgi:nitronate monooxygenase